MDLTKSEQVLQKYNAAAFVLHVVVLLFEIVVIATMYRNDDNAVEVKSYLNSQLNQNRILNSGDVMNKTRLVIQGDTSILPVLLLSFTVITAGAHGAYAWVPGIRKRYLEGIRDQNNWLRWVEYAITASIMLVIVALCCNVVDANVLCILPILSVCVMMLGHLAEKHMSMTGTPNLRTSSLITIIAWLVYLVAWSFVFTQYIEVTYQLSLIPEAPEIPAYVPVTLFVMFAMFSSFGLVQLVQLVKLTRTGKQEAADYQKIEMAYISL